jgi:uncharacterized membrane protein
MSGEYLLMLVVRWLHILAAALALGVPWYVRLVLMPAMATLDEEQRARFQEALTKRWRMIVHLLILVFLATGFYTFLVVARWKAFDPEDRKWYHMIFGVKFLIALAMFTISSGLAGRSKLFAPMRQTGHLWLGVLLLLGLLIVALSGVLRFMPW